MTEPAPIVEVHPMWAVMERTGRCMRGHSLDDAYVVRRTTTDKVTRTCRTCAIERRAARADEIRARERARYAERAKDPAFRARHAAMEQARKARKRGEQS